MAVPLAEGSWPLALVAVGPAAAWAALKAPTKANLRQHPQLSQRPLFRDARTVGVSWSLRGGRCSVAVAAWTYVGQ